MGGCGDLSVESGAHLFGAALQARCALPRLVARRGLHLRRPRARAPAGAAARVCTQRTLACALLPPSPAAARERRGAAAMAQTVEEWYKAMPVVTRTYLTVSFFTTAACALDVRRPRLQRRARTQPAGRLARAARPCCVVAARQRHCGSFGLELEAARVRIASLTRLRCALRSSSRLSPSTSTRA